MVRDREAMVATGPPAETEEMAVMALPVLTAGAVGREAPRVTAATRALRV